MASTTSMTSGSSAPPHEPLQPLLAASATSSTSSSTSSATTVATLSAGSTSSSTSTSPLLHSATEAAHSGTTSRPSPSPSSSSAASSSSSSIHFNSSSSEDDESSSSAHGSPFVSSSSSSSSSRGGTQSLSSSAPSSTTLFVPAASPSSFGASAPVAAALAASLGLANAAGSSGGVGGLGSPSAATAAAAAAAAYMASPTGHLLSRSMSASKLHQVMKKKKANVRYKDHCDNCLTDQTPQWRKGRRGETFCQDCGRSERRHDYARLKREREKAIEKTLIDLLENSVYVPRWGQASAVPARQQQQQQQQPQQSAEGELDDDRDAEEEKEQPSAESSLESAAITITSEAKVELTPAAGDDICGNGGHNEMERDGDSNGRQAAADSSSGSGIVGKRKNVEDDGADNEQKENGEHSATSAVGVEDAPMECAPPGGDEEASPAALVAEDGKAEAAAEDQGSPATKRRRLPNAPAGQPSPVRLAKRRTSPAATATAIVQAHGAGAVVGSENNGTTTPALAAATIQDSFDANGDHGDERAAAVASSVAAAHAPVPVENMEG